MPAKASAEAHWKTELFASQASQLPHKSAHALGLLTQQPKSRPQWCERTRSTVGAGLPAKASAGSHGKTELSASQASQLPHKSAHALGLLTQQPKSRPQWCRGTRSTVGAGLPAKASTGSHWKTELPASQASQPPHKSKSAISAGSISAIPAIVDMPKNKQKKGDRSRPKCLACSCNPERLTVLYAY